MTSTNDDEVIRKRLLIDGDGGGDERRLNALMKLFIKWCNSSDADHSTHQRMLSFLAQSEYAMTKASFVYKMNMQQMERYQQLQEEIDRNVELAHEEIKVCKNELAAARQVRRNRQEYDALAGAALKHPDREKTETQIKDINSELEELRATECRLAAKLDLRKKQFHALLTSIHQLREILKDEERRKNTATKLSRAMPAKILPPTKRERQYSIPINDDDDENCVSNGVEEDMDTMPPPP